MKKRLALLSMSVFALIISANTPAAANESSSHASQSRAGEASAFRSTDAGAPLAKMLNADGTLNLPPGSSGNLDARGWELVSGENEPPRFIPTRRWGPDDAKSYSRFDAPTDRGPLAPLETPRVSGDERWASDFVPRGAISVDRIVAGAGSDLYVSGDFWVIGDVFANHIAKWDGSHWSALGYGLNYSPWALAWDNTHGILYAGGQISGICTNAECSGSVTRTNNVARWDGNTWSPLVSTSPAMYGTDSVIDSMTLDNQNNLFIGGRFAGLCTNVDCTTTTPANNIAKWTWATSTWSTLAVGGNIGVSGGGVFALAWWNAAWPVGSVLVAGGAFTSAGGTAVNRLAVWNGYSWSSFWSGVDDDVYAFAVEPTTQTVVVGGRFNNICRIGDTPPACTPIRVNHLAAATGALNYWGALGFGVNNDIYAIAIDSAASRVYVGGFFNNLCTNAACSTTIPANYIAAIDYSSPSFPWSALGSGANTIYGLRALAIQSGSVYAGGHYVEVVGGVPASGIAKWTPGSPGSWSALNTGNGLSKSVKAVAADAAGNVYVGGYFKAAGGTIVNNIARWNVQTHTWSTLGFGVGGMQNGGVLALAPDKDGTLFVGGYFKYLCLNADCAAGSQVNNLAKWTPGPGGSGTWSPVDNGIAGYVQALTFDQDGNLYVGGGVTGRCPDQACAAPTTVHGLLKWTRASGLLAPFGAALPDGHQIWAMIIDRSGALYVGGQIQAVCTNSDCSGALARVNSIAKWTPGGSSGVWSTLAGGLIGQAAAFAVDANNRLYVGGWFQYTCPDVTCSTAGLNVNYIAVWTPNGSTGTWSQVGKGFFGPDGGANGEVNGLTLDDNNNLYATGSFSNLCQDDTCTTAGAAANSIAKWNGSAWSAMGSGLGPVVLYLSYNTGTAISAHAGTVSVGGGFTIAGSKAAAFFSQYRDYSLLYLPMLTR